MKWTRVKKKLPEEGYLYLCTDGEDIEMMAYYGSFKSDQDWCSYSGNNIEVTHWMPLPELPED